MNIEEIVNMKRDMFQDEEYGFEVFACMKEGDIPIKRLKLYEGNNEGEENFKRKIEEAIVSVIKGKYVDEIGRYDTAENIEDNQHKFYIVEQNDSYNPFRYLNISEELVPLFSEKDRVNISGIMFKFRRENIVIWAYQHSYADIVANKKNAKFFSCQQGDTFVEMKTPVFTINKKVDLLIIGENIIVENILLIQRNFGFEEYVRGNAKKIIENIDKMEIIGDIDKLSRYTDRKQMTYAKKMMRIKKYEIFDVPAKVWIEKVQSTERWKGVFSINNEKIEINSYKDVEHLLELLSEQYTRSDVTGREYISDVKKPAPPKRAGM